MGYFWASFASSLHRRSDTCDGCRGLLLRMLAMYACIAESERGFFEGVCAPNDATAHFRDPPPPIRESQRPVPHQFANRL